MPQVGCGRGEDCAWRPDSGWEFTAAVLGRACGDTAVRLGRAYYQYEPVILFLNHSCEPNVGFAGNVVLVAMRDIGPCEELSTDYAFFNDHDEATVPP